MQKIVLEQMVDIIVVMHDINLAVRYAKYVVILDDKGSLHSAGIPREIISVEMLREVYGIMANVTHDENGVPVALPPKELQIVYIRDCKVIQ